MSKKINLVLGFAGPYGAGCSSLAEDVKQIIDNWPGCIAKKVHVSELIERYYPIIFNEKLVIKNDDLAKRREELQNAGSKLRKFDPQIIGKIISTDIFEKGLEVENDPIESTINTIVFIVDSLKNSYDIEVLHKTYLDEFFFAFIHADRESRWRRMIDYKSWKKTDRVKFEQRDQIDQNEKLHTPEIKDRGQQVEKLAGLADYYIVNNQNREKLKNDGKRLISVLFGSSKNQPTIQERFMHIAFSASNASFCLSRQVGAAIVDSKGTILGIGHNDVPKAFGGLYSQEDVEDRRCYLVGDRRCINDTNKQERFEDLSEEITKNFDLKENESKALKRIITNSPFREVIEYCRAVHAEMEALLSVARTSKGATAGATMYVTTEPCHNCTKHIICAGIKKVYFMEPYPKSLGLELHSDAISVGAENEVCSGTKVQFIPYGGIAPHRFHDFFYFTKGRKDDTGRYMFRSKELQSKSPKFAKRDLLRSRKENETIDPIGALEYTNAGQIGVLIEAADLTEAAEKIERKKL